MKLVKRILFPRLLGYLVMLNFACTSSSEDTAQHLFYLHGRIIEVQGVEAVSPRFGPYKYEQIIDSLNILADYVYAEVRPESVDFSSFCAHISNQIDSLIAAGIAPETITVLGASKGAAMAMQISNDNPNPINYVLLAANNDYLEQENNWSLHGRILGLYEESDQLAGKNYNYWMARSPKAVVFEQLKLKTGLGHGFLYRPLSVWLDPLKNWIKQPRKEGQ